MLRAAFLSVITLLLAAGPAHAAHCARHRGEHVAARSARAVVFVRDSEVGDDVVDTILTGCSRRTGARLRIDTLENDFYGGDALGDVRLNGTAMAYEVGFDDPKGGLEDPDGFVVKVADAVHERAPAFVAAGVALAPGRLDHWTLGPRGEVAWAPGGGALELWTLTDGNRLLDRGAAIGPPRIAGGHVTWTHDGRPASAPLRLPRTHCNLDPSDGTPELDVTVAYGDLLVVCRRASGVALRTHIPGSFGATQLHLAFGGTYAAVPTRDGVLVFDTVAGAVRTIPVTSTVGDAVVDEHGDLAWTDRDADGRWRLWIEDAGGRHTAGEPADDERAAVGRDGSVVTFNGQAFALEPRTS